MIKKVFLIFRQTANIYNKDADYNRPYFNAGPNTTKRALQDIQDFDDAAI